MNLIYVALFRLGKEWTWYYYYYYFNGGRNSFKLNCLIYIYVGKNGQLLTYVYMYICTIVNIWFSCLFDLHLTSIGKPFQLFSSKANSILLKTKKFRIPLFLCAVERQEIIDNFFSLRE